MDALLFSAIVRQLRRECEGARVNRVDQPKPSEVWLHLRRPGRNLRLLISIDHMHARMHLTTSDPTVPAFPPAFCMLLRRRLAGARLVSISQPEMERFCHLNFASSDDLGEPSTWTLVVEIMGKRSNVCLLDASGRITGVLRPVHAAQNRYRQLLPGIQYVGPPDPGKTHPRDVSADLFWEKAGSDPRMCESSVLSVVKGFGPVLAAEACRRAAQAITGDLASELARASSGIWLECESRGNASIYLDKAGNPVAIHVADLGIDHGGRREFPGISEALDFAYEISIGRQAFASAVHAARQILGSLLSKVEKRLLLRKAEIVEAQASDDLRLSADLILTYLPTVKQALAHKQNHVMLLDAATGVEKGVVLDISKTAADNAQAYYRKYSKLRLRLSSLAPQVDKDAADIHYLQSVLGSLEFAKYQQDVDDILLELQNQGFIDRPQSVTRDAKKAARPAAPVPDSHHTSDGEQVLVGRNNRQNDYVTSRLARPADLWLHAKGVPGAHVILKVDRTEPSRESIEEAASLAAYYSSAKESSKVEVDYTQAKYVRKPPGARPGAVIYDHHRTIVVKPEPPRATEVP